jgi:succinate dehydrogenase / fumarate reductase cytochrome b subunit
MADLATASKARPKFTNIHVTQIIAYRLPLAGMISILHRVSGAILFLALPLLLYLFDKSLTSEISFVTFREVTSHWLVKLVILGLSWAYLHHLCAGVRHLVMDLHMGLEKEQGAKSALAVFAVSLPLAALVALKLFGVF